MDHADVKKDHYFPDLAYYYFSLFYILKKIMIGSFFQHIYVIEQIDFHVDFENWETHTKKCSIEISVKEIYFYW